MKTNKMPHINFKDRLRVTFTFTFIAAITFVLASYIAKNTGKNLYRFAVTEDEHQNMEKL